MIAPFNPGDVLTISTASYKDRRFTVVESNRHRTRLEGRRGAQRVLVLRVGLFGVDGSVVSDQVYGHIIEDDGGRNRSQACKVEVANRRNKDEPDPPRPRTYPLTAHGLAALIMCETAADVAGWVMEREATHACVTGDQRAADTAAAMKLYLSSIDLRRVSEAAAE